MILIGLYYTLVLCHSFKGCALPPSFLFHALCLGPIQTHKVASTIFWRDNQKITGLGRKILYNIQPLNPTLYWSHWRPWGRHNSSPGVPGGHHALTCLGIWSLKGCHASTCSGIRVGFPLSRFRHDGPSLALDFLCIPPPLRELR